MSARNPVPAMRLAVINMCEREKREISAEMTHLSLLWKQYCTKSHYDNTNIIYVRANAAIANANTAPLGNRPAKIKAAKDSIRQFRLQMERDFMMYEDDISRLTNKYLNIDEYRLDYDKYYIIASRYGMFSETEFLLDSRPGERYQHKIIQAQRLICHLWKRYWPLVKAKRIRACIKIQRIWRGYHIYVKWYPIIRFRLKVGKPHYIRFYYKLWLDYNILRRKIRIAIRYQKGAWLPVCFASWKNWFINKSLHDQVVIKNMSIRRVHLVQQFSYHQWKYFTTHLKHLKTFMRRVLNAPQFARWVLYVEHCRHVRKLRKMATVIQAGIRCFLVRCRLAHQKHAALIIENFGHLVLAKHRTKKLKKNIIEMQFQEWLPTELSRIMRLANEKERRRLIRRQKYLQDKEKENIEELKSHFLIHDGKMQLKHLTHERLQQQGIIISNIQKKEYKKALLETEKILLHQCADFCRILHTHDFESKNAPVCYCADITCGAIFATEEQYHNHMINAENHLGKPPQYSRFHMLINTNKGQDIIRRFILRLEGIGGLANILDLYISIQEWKKVTFKSDHYISKALFLYETFLREKCSRPLPSSLQSNYSNINNLIVKMESIKARKYNGFYKLEKIEPNKLRNVFGLDGQQYEAWTTENIIPADIFHELEWKAFLYLFEALESRGFEQSSEMEIFRNSLIEVEKLRMNALFEDFLEYQKRKLELWSEEFMIEDRKITEYAKMVVMKALDHVIGIQVEKSIKSIVRQKVFNHSCIEQSKHEPIKLLIDDVLYWLTSDITEEIFTFYSNILINSMWEVPEFKKCLLRFIGKDVFTYMEEESDEQGNGAGVEDADIGGDYWFEKFTEAAIIEEQSLLPLDPDNAAIRIQRLFRGIMGRKIARKIFVKTYGKRYVKLLDIILLYYITILLIFRFDATYQTFYYVNMITGESSWERPHITKYLLPQSTW